MEYLILILTFVFGAVLGVLLGANRASRQYARQAESAEAQNRSQRQQDEERRRRETELLEASMMQQQKRFDETIEKMSAQLKSTTEEMLKARQQEFAETSQQHIVQIVSPLKDSVERMKQALSENSMKQSELGATMKTNIEHMMRQSEAARKSAEELAHALKHGSKIQGDWGETVLDELLRSQGLTCGVHYDTQAVIKDAMGNTVRNTQGSILRPDVILHLDQEREVIIDSKVSLTAFIDYVNAEDEVSGQRFLKAHVESLQKHVAELSAKDYSAYIQPPKVRMDYVIMFVPHTGALWTALTAQPDLWRSAMEKNVFIADEQTLFAALRIVALTWKQIEQARNQEKVFALATEMMDRVGQFVKQYDAMGKALEQAQQAYGQSMKKLAPNGQSILTTCKKLQALGAKQSITNPLPIISEDV